MKICSTFTPLEKFIPHLPYFSILKKITFHKSVPNIPNALYKAPSSSQFSTKTPWPSVIPNRPRNHRHPTATPASGSAALPSALSPPLIISIAYYRPNFKEGRDSITEGILTDTEKMLARGKMDVPLSLCFAAARGDDLLLHQLLRRGLDANELECGGRSALHIAASLGSEHCVSLLIEYGANPNIKDSEGATPLWDAIMGKHDHIIKLLIDNGAKLTSGDVGNYACIAAEQNDQSLLKDIIKYGGDVTLPNYCGTTALHAAVSEGNIEIVKFLLDRGADVDKPDIHGWTPRDLAEHQSHEEIVALFLTKQQKAHNPQDTVSKQPPVYQSPRKKSVLYLPKYNSEPLMTPNLVYNKRLTPTLQHPFGL